MFALFFHGLQQDVKLFCVAPVICALFRLIFIAVYGSYPSLTGQWKKFYHCFRYGFWWGMDWNSYVLIYSAILVSLPGAFFPQWFALGDSLRVFGVCAYIAILYAAFLGKLVYYYHYRDIYNKTLWMGKNADKKNLLDIFFNQNHGALILLSFIPFLLVCDYSVQLLLSTPTIPYPAFSSNIYRYLFNTMSVAVIVALFYYCRYGGSFNHANKPEWDEIPTIVKEDIFLAKATLDDLVALELVWKYPPHELLNHSDEESASLIDTVIPKEDWRNLAQPLSAFARTAQGPRITLPKHIFYLLAESYEQAPLDPPYANLHIADAGKAFCADAHTFTIPNFLSAGLLSQPSLVSLLLGIYDAELELNEREDFWHNTVPTALPLQMHALGYRTAFWYGGELNWGSLQHFLPAAGFDEMHGAPDFCPSNAPRTWLGVYDHIFLTEAGKRIRATDDEKPVLHFLYTTSNHGPYTIPVDDYGFSTEKIMPDAPEAVRKSRMVQRKLGCYWYTDQALFRFIREMQEAFPDSLFIVTGDHAMHVLPFDCNISMRSQPTLREKIGDFCAFWHPMLNADVWAENVIGGHMNILPTIIELIAPKGHPYLSLFPPLTEKISTVVTPHHWLTETQIGSFDDNLCQAIDADEEPHTTSDGGELRVQRDGWRELSGWLCRHPELLKPCNQYK